jgi:hypothetical protein
MKLIERRISDLDYRIYTSDSRDANDVSVVVLEFIGTYKYGSDGFGDGRLMQAIAECAIEMFDADALLFDFRRLSYQFGNNIWDGFPRDLPYHIVVSDLCRAGLGGSDICNGPLLFDDFEVALLDLVNKRSNRTPGQSD